MWLRRLVGNVSLPWLVGAVVLCVASFVVGVAIFGPPEGPITAEERPTPHVPTPPSSTPPPPSYTTEELKKLEVQFKSASADPKPIVIELKGLHTAGKTLTFLNGRKVKLPDDVYVGDRADRYSCRAEPCPHPPVQMLVRGKERLWIDAYGVPVATTGWNDGVDLSQFSFLNKADAN